MEIKRKQISFVSELCVYWALRTTGFGVNKFMIIYL